MEFLESALAKLTDIWDTIGITGNALVARRQVVMLHLTNLVEEMVREEEAMKASIMDNVEKYGKEVHWLCKELGSSLYEVSSSNGITSFSLLNAHCSIKLCILPCSYVFSQFKNYIFPIIPYLSTWYSC